MRPVDGRLRRVPGGAVKTCTFAAAFLTSRLATGARANERVASGCGIRVVCPTMAEGRVVAADFRLGRGSLLASTGLREAWDDGVQAVVD